MTDTPPVLPERTPLRCITEVGTWDCVPVEYAEALESAYAKAREALETIDGMYPACYGDYALVGRDAERVARLALRSLPKVPK